MSRRVVLRGHAVGLTPRQAEVLVLIRLGMSARTIAEELGLSPRTVQWHLASLYDLYGVHSNVQLLARVSELEGQQRLPY